ncbi:MAG TPA: hypothetical protein VK066_02425 [Chloroflexota bacterium]|nr:hypothetical protein [Chloroflexota bacterium]
MPEQHQLPSEQAFNGFVGRLREFRSTLPQEDQRMLDAMVQAAFKTEEQGDVQGYWFAVQPTPYGPVAVGAPGPVPGFYVAPPPPPVYAVSPWGVTYVRYW